jgi:hypothetical protein
MVSGGAPVFADEDYSPESIALRYKDYASSGTEGFTRAYTEILEHAPPSYRRVFIRQGQAGGGVRDSLHRGQDRTGVLAALILGLAGVDERTIAHEYALTEIGALRPVIMQRLIDQPALEETGGSEYGQRKVSDLPLTKLWAC